MDDAKLMAEYGAGRIFRERAAALSEKANEYFTSKPDQHREGEFSSLLATSKGYAERRNDIAHGIAFRIDRITWFRNQLKPHLLRRAHFSLVPPLYANRYASSAGFPLFSYTSVEMGRIAKRLLKLQREVEGFRKNT